jgi:hypothetical protein
MRLRKYRHLLGGAILVAGCALMLSGCMFGGDDADDGTTSGTIRNAKAPTTVASVADVGAPVVVSPADRYSNFQTKDPFIQQQEPVESGEGSSPATTTPPTPTTTTTTTTTSSSTTSTTSTTSTSSTTSTTSFYAHMLQILSVGDVGGSPAVTYQVDNTVYEDQRVGNKVSTSWGDVTVVGINTDAKVVTLLHDSKTLTLAERQILFE